MSSKSIPVKVSSPVCNRSRATSKVSKISSLLPRLLFRYEQRNSYDGPTDYESPTCSLPAGSISISRHQKGSLTSSLNSTHNFWSGQALLETCNQIRLSLSAVNSPTGFPGDVLDRLLGQLSDTEGTRHAIDCTTVIAAHLDRLISSLLEERTLGKSARPWLLDATVRATQIHDSWLGRFKSEFAMADEIRTRKLLQSPSGRLRDVQIGPQGFGRVGWVTKVKPGMEADKIGNLDHEIGSWWLNTACAYRDRIISDINGLSRAGCYGVTNLCLLDGTETDEPGVDQSIWVKDGDLRATSHMLMLHVGKVVRLLRGCGLRSKHAPRAGLRYDGLYKLESYGMKLNTTNEVWRASVTLVRIPEQAKQLIDLGDIPLPSALDEWDLYKAFERRTREEQMKPIAYAEWSAQQAHQLKLKEEWKIEQLRQMVPLGV